MNDARMSFPSGHASSTFASAIVVSLYLAGKVGLLRSSNGKGGSVWALLITLSPLAVSFFITLSRYIDYHHDTDDITSGMLLGLVMGILAYHLNYPLLTDAECAIPISRVSEHNHQVEVSEYQADNDDAINPKEEYALDTLF